MTNITEIFNNLGAYLAAIEARLVTLENASGSATGWYGDFNFLITKANPYSALSGSVIVNVYVMNTSPTIYIYNSEQLYAGEYSNSLAQASRLINSTSKIYITIQEDPETIITTSIFITGGSPNADPNYYNGVEITPNNNNPFDPITISFVIDINK
jgi:hypothetical protein